METKIPIPKGWNKRVQSAILQAISLGRHCFVSIVARMANSPNAVDRIVAENEHLEHEVESRRVELEASRMPEWPGCRPSDALTTPPPNACRFFSCVLGEAGTWQRPQTGSS